MKNWCLYIIMMLAFVSCSEQQTMEDTLASQKLSEKKSVVVATPQDSIASLLHQARWGDS